MNSDIKSELEAIGVKVMVPDDPEPIKSGHQWEDLYVLGVGKFFKFLKGTLFFSDLFRPDRSVYK